MNQNNEKIDIVITWVDGNDPEWLKEKEQYLSIKGDKSKNRFRDSNNLQYIFRGIETYMPWVNKVYFITWGHLPKWLNTNCKKLVVVNHKDYIPENYLPTYNSNVLEMNIHRIKGLADKFILFNDDLFVLKPLKPEEFFEDGLPKDRYVEYKIDNPSKRAKILKNNYDSIIYKHFNKKDVINKNKSKIINLKYGLDNLKTLKYINSTKFEDIHSEHLTQSFLKESFERIWDEEYEALDTACKNKFRADTDMGNQICRFYQLFEGKFIPRKKIGKYFILKEDNTELIKTIKSNKYKVICINDANPDIDFDTKIKEINDAFEKILPNKSSFEK